MNQDDVCPVERNGWRFDSAETEFVPVELDWFSHGSVLVWDAKWNFRRIAEDVATRDQLNAVVGDAGLIMISDFHTSITGTEIKSAYVARA